MDGGDPAPAPSRRSERTPRLVIAVFAAACPVLGFLSARGMPVLLILGLLVLLAVRLRRPAMPEFADIVPFALLIILGFASIAWSVAPALSLAQSLQLAGIGVPGILLISVLRTGPQAAGALTWLAVGCALGMIILLLDLLAGYPIYRALHRLPPQEEVEAYIHNKAVTALPLFLFPALLALQAAIAGRRRALAWQVSLVAFVFAGILVTPSQSAVAGIVGGIAVLVGAVVRERLVRTALGAAIVAAALLAPLGAAILPEPGSPHLTALPYSAAQRIEIWRYASSLILEHPWLGIGLDGARHALSIAAGPIQGSLHTHNLFLQIWLELGLPGVAWLIAFSLLVLHRIGRMPRRARPYADATFAAAVLISSFAWGFWQTWWLATMFVSAALLAALAASLHAD